MTRLIYGACIWNCGVVGKHTIFIARDEGGTKKVYVHFEVYVFITFTLWDKTVGSLLFSRSWGTLVCIAQCGKIGDPGYINDQLTSCLNPILLVPMHHCFLFEALQCLIVSQKIFLRVCVCSNTGVLLPWPLLCTLNPCYLRYMP